MKLAFFLSFITYLSFSQDKKLPFPNIAKPINSYEYITDTINGLFFYKNISGDPMKGSYYITHFLKKRNSKKKNIIRDTLIDANGNKMEILECGNGRVFSDYKSLNKREEGSFAEGYKNGFWKTTYKNKLIKTINYKNGLVIGRYRVYSIKGELLYKTTFGSLGNGKFKDYYYETGILREEGNYVNGKKQGEWCFYDEQGSLVKTIDYK
ncbi:hypothetical protein A8C32_14750 [Flavivirga aquatica]|uniref:Toxin-antitoxin system YwqK family antitoxin n=1 Tax=Flavivirga aquatica TaxID=1849968 RepID=A0A1E5T9S3_9FLAO|nr:hypothetical protein [Flavivirga aquatica]OEK08086.1 hypothetical protein A8C32_14750 [Flavivirga aquatica]